MNRPFAIVSASFEDIEILTKIALASKGHWGYPPKWLESWRSEIEITPESIQNDTIFKAVDENGEILGFYRLTKQREKLVLSGFWVLSKNMGIGVGKALYLHMIEKAKSLRASRIEWESDPNAATFYKKMGAKKIGDKVYLLDGKERILPIFEVKL